MHTKFSNNTYRRIPVSKFSSPSTDGKFRSRQEAKELICFFKKKIFRTTSTEPITSEVLDFIPYINTGKVLIYSPIDTKYLNLVTR